MKIQPKKSKTLLRNAAQSKQTPIAFEPDNRAFLERVRREVGLNRWSFTATVNYVIQMARDGKAIEVK